jgi:peptidoglycan/xylan/chitin deacetylase (PgdA/CDA1 family)
VSALRLASVSVDLDSLPHYCRIHGLDPRALPERARHLVYREALPRFLDLFAELGLRATFFAVGADLEEDPRSSSAIAQAARAGHEIGNHSGAHDYALTRASAEAIAADLARGERACEAASGERPKGFRAPGYTLSAPLLRELVARGYRYDSSAFPAAPYYLAKAATLGALAALRRPSRAILDRPRALLAPRTPYRPDPREPYASGDLPLIELPIAVTRWTRMPVIGTAMVGLPEGAAALLQRGVRDLAHLNLELHGIDLLDASDAGHPPLQRAQRELAIPAPLKRRRLRAALLRLRGAREVVALEVAAQRFSEGSLGSPV